METILIIEDDESNRITLCALLDDEGFKIVEAASLKEARERMRVPGADFGLILTDQHLGDGLGSDLLPEMRERFPRAKVVLISGSVRPDDLPEGMDALLPKGTEFTTVLSLLRSLLK